MLSTWEGKILPVLNSAYFRKTCDFVEVKLHMFLLFILRIWQNGRVIPGNVGFRALSILRYYKENNVSETVSVSVLRIGAERHLFCWPL
jgi:hypothetical protein